jgi:hypothetical protein
VPNVSALNFIRHKLLDLKKQIDPKTVLVGDVNTTLSPTDGHPEKKISKETLELNDTID